MNSSSSSSDNKQNRDSTKNGGNCDLSQMCITFLHLDLGIGGAEQLVLQLAHASRRCQLNDKSNKKVHMVELWTTRCDPSHCFASVRPGGILHPCLRVHGRWIPAEILGKGRALCSTIRLWYLALRWIWANGRQPNQIIVLDVLPTPLPLLQALTKAHILFYCHFPDQLLTQRSQPTSNRCQSLPRGYYRALLNWMENSTMPFADTIVVNSKFTRTVVQETFPALRTMDLPVLYPALDTESLDETAKQERSDVDTQQSLRPIVSLNRYERKKNLQLLLEAARWIRRNHPTVQIPPIVIAGGYDIHNVENVEYRGELGQLAKDYALEDVVSFRQSISDQERKELLRTALCVVYTPSHEHFGIVPLEAMYCNTPVLAVNSGGPMESILDGQTGFLRPATAHDFGQALMSWITQPNLAQQMGKAGHEHVKARFGFDPRFVQEWQTLLQETMRRGTKRQGEKFHHQYRLGHSFVYIVEFLLVLGICLLLTDMLRRTSVLQPDESLLSGIKRGFRQEEL